MLAFRGSGFGIRDSRIKPWCGVRGPKPESRAPTSDVSMPARAPSTRRRGLRKRLARQHLIAVGREVHERGDDDGVLAHVLVLDALVDVHVRVVRARAVLDRILDELEA